MWGLPRESRGIDNLKRENTFLGVVFGDTYVAAAVAHVDVLGPVYGYCRNHVFFNRNRKHAMGINELEAALRECLEGLGVDLQFECSRCLVSLPPWAVRGRIGEARLTIPSEPGTRMPSEGRQVDDGIVRSLQDTLFAKSIPAGLTLADFHPHFYTTDTGVTVTDPRHMCTNSLGLRAYMVMEELSATRAILDGVRKAGLRVGHITTAHSATSFNLWPEEKQRPIALIEVDRLRTYLSAFADGVLIHTCAIENGSADTLADTAQRMGVTTRDMGTWLNEREELLHYADSSVEICWPSVSRRPDGPQRLGDMDAAAAPSAEKLAGMISAALKNVDEDVKRCAENIVLMGDDPLALRALRAQWTVPGRTRCDWRVPAGVHGGRLLHMPGYARMIGLLRMPRLWKERRQPFLETFNQSIVDTVNTTIREGLANGYEKSRAPRAAFACAPPGFSDSIRRWLF